jgi:hypothetical protein
MGHRLISWVVTDVSEEHAAFIFGNVGNPVQKSRVINHNITALILTTVKIFKSHLLQNAL